MKKIRDTRGYRKLQVRRLKRSLRVSNQRGRSVRRRFNIAKIRQHVLTQGLGYFNHPAPPIFSFIREPEAMIDFIEQLKVLLFQLNRSVVIDLSEVREVTNDSIILLLSVVQDRRVSRSTKVAVKNPTDEKAAKRLRESGIDEHYEVQDLATPKSGRIKVKRSYDADTEMANELIQFATRELFGRRRKLTNVQRILSECISNTEEHASGESGRSKEKMWWGTVFCEKRKGTAFFSLLDNGVGIIESLRSEWFGRLPILARYPDNISLMKGVFDGKVLSSTNLSNRGNGLPAIYKARSRKQFGRLILITNNVYIDFDNNDFRILRNSFAGTFFYWEVDKNANGKP
jgi:hypothetical protein